MRTAVWDTAGCSQAWCLCEWSCSVCEDTPDLQAPETDTVFQVLCWFQWSCRSILHFTHILEVSDLSDDVFDTGERKTWITKTHLPTAQVRPQQLQHQTNIYIVVKNQLLICIAVLYKILKLYKSILRTEQILKLILYNSSNTGLPDAVTFIIYLWIFTVKIQYF